MWWLGTSSQVEPLLPHACFAPIAAPCASTAVPRAAAGGWSVAGKVVRHGAGGLARRRRYVVTFVPHQSYSRLLIQLRDWVCAGLTPAFSGARAISELLRDRRSRAQLQRTVRL